MQTQNFTTTINFTSTPEEVYNAINNVRGWWQGEIHGITDKAGEEFSYRMKEFHFSTQKITELIPYEKIVWKVTSSELSFISKKDEWTGTTIQFELTNIPEGTRLVFEHKGLSPGIECYKDCSNGWNMLIHKSLKSLVETGKGLDVF
jgi:hypothetical protein